MASATSPPTLKTCDHHHNTTTTHHSPMETELRNLLSVWAVVIASLYYSHTLGKHLPSGKLRLALLLPVVFLFLLLPLPLTFVNFCGFTSFFISWLANFKLLLFAYGHGPLSPPTPLPFLPFLTLACFPIKITTPSSSPPPPHKYGFKKMARSLLLYALVLHLQSYSKNLHPRIHILLCCIQVYTILELGMGMVATMARLVVGMELEPQFNAPLLATSLQDFWGRRWNIMVSGVLKQAVYLPVVEVSIAFVGRRWASIPGVLATFGVSAIMHELIYFYLCRTWPTWEISLFFVIHGVCEAGEIAVKKVVRGRVRVSPLVSVPLTEGFVFFTVFWLFFQQLFRCDVLTRGMEEMAAFRDLFRVYGGGAVL